MPAHDPSLFPRPVSGDCVEYYFRYINLVPDGDVVTYLEQQLKDFKEFIIPLTPVQLHFRYEPGKWSLAEMIGHVLDAERVFAYRMMCISRGEQKNLPGFEQDDYVNGSVYDLFAAVDLAAEWHAVRSSTVLLAHHMTGEMAARMGMANQYPARASAFAWIMAGHVNHHRKVAEDKYLVHRP